MTEEQALLTVRVRDLLQLAREQAYELSLLPSSDRTLLLKAVHAIDKAIDARDVADEFLRYDRPQSANEAVIV